MREAQDALADVSEATPAEVAEAQADVGAAAEALSNAQADLAAAKQASAEDVGDAEDVVADAEADYAETFRRWFGIRLTESELRVDPTTLLTGWGADLDALFSHQSPLRGDSGVINVPDNDPATPWNEATLYSWLTLFPGIVAGTCDDDQVLFQVACAEREMNNAWAVLVDARDALSTAVVAAARSGLSAEAAIAKAKDDLATAEDAMAALLSPDPLDIATAAADVALARAELADAEAALAEVLADGDALEIRLLRTEITIAEQSLATTKENLAGAALVAPITGVVETVAMEPGDQADQTPVLIELVNIAAGEPESETAAFSIAGEVGQVFVAEGDAVTEGQALATLDDLTQASLERAVVDAEVKLREAQDDLQSLLTPDQLGLAAAAKAAVLARTKLADAEDVLAEALAAVEADGAGGRAAEDGAGGRRTGPRDGKRESRGRNARRAHRGRGRNGVNGAGRPNEPSIGASAGADRNRGHVRRRNRRVRGRDRRACHTRGRAGCREHDGAAGANANWHDQRHRSRGNRPVRARHVPPHHPGRCPAGRHAARGTECYV